VTLHELLLPTISRWLGLLALAVLVGGLVVDLFVLPRDDVTQLAAARRRLWLWGALAVAVLIVTSAGDLIARARIMSGGDFSQAAAALPLVLTRTHFGAIWVARAVTLALLMVVSVSRAVPFRAAGLVLSLGVALSLSLTGHAADSGDYSLSVLIDWLHAIAATIWTGGLFGLTLTMCRDQSTWPRELVGIVAQRFSQRAGYCLLVVLATGIYNAWAQVPSFAALWTTTYGVALLLKICLALVLAFLGAINRYGVLPALGVVAARREAAAEKLSRFVVREALVAIVVFGCTAVLAESTPKSHEGHMSHGAAHGGSSEEPF
jgi:putative copper resistance protein D